MSVSRVLLYGILLLGSSAAASAKPLTCEQYKDRLGGALLATGEKKVDVPKFTLGFSDPVRGRRYDWGTLNLTGTLKCGPGDEFEEVYVSAAFERKDQFADTIQNFIVVSAATVCALSTNGAPACSDFSRSMLQDSLEQIGRAYNRGATRPSGLTNRDVVPGAKAELTAASTLVTLLIGPGRGATIDEERQPLAASPANAKP